LGFPGPAIGKLAGGAVGKALPVHPWSLKGDSMSWRMAVLFHLSAVEMGVHAGCMGCAKLTSATAWLRNGPGQSGSKAGGLPARHRDV
jgi:hypothetical protein